MVCGVRHCVLVNRCVFSVQGCLWVYERAVRLYVFVKLSWYLRSPGVCVCDLYNCEVCVPAVCKSVVCVPSCVLVEFYLSVEFLH